MEHGPSSTRPAQLEQLITTCQGHPLLHQHLCSSVLLHRLWGNTTLSSGQIPSRANPKSLQTPPRAGVWGLDVTNSTELSRVRSPLSVLVRPVLRSSRLEPCTSHFRESSEPLTSPRMFLPLDLHKQSNHLLLLNEQDKRHLSSAPFIHVAKDPINLNQR